MREKLFGVILAGFTTVLLSACGDSSGGASFVIGDGGVSTGDTGAISIGISDAPVDDVEEVVVEIDSITLQKSGEDDIVVDRFTSADLGLTDEDTFQIDLLAYQGGEQAIVIDNIEVASGEYTDLILRVIDEDVNNSYVMELGGDQVAIKVPSDTLKLGGFTVDNDGEQTFTIEFNLRQAMTYRPGPDVYNLKPRGIRLQDNDGARSIGGEVDSSLFDTESPCDTKSDPTLGNVMYLYEGHDLNVDDLADVFDSESDDLTTTIPANAILPFAAEAVSEKTTDEWEYDIAFLPAGEYTLVFSCNALDDDPVQYDGLTIAVPEDQIIEVDLATADIVCDFPIVDDACS